MAVPEAVGVEPTGDDATISRQQWKWSILAGMASYLDAGSIVARHWPRHPLCAC